MLEGKWPLNYRTIIFLNCNMNKLVINLDVNRVYKGIFELNPPPTPLDLDIYFNDEKIFEFNKSLKQSNFCKEITDLPDDRCCDLRFVMNNKNHEHTKIDAEGNIVGDCRIAISNIKFDNIGLGHLVVEQAVYLHGKNIQDSQFEKNKFYGEMGCNGTVELKFTTPVYLWLLEHM